ncbi:hypothetical protein Tco_0427626, partial [Tanacetum coccineum]
YSIKYVMGQSTIDNVVKTATNLSAAGIMLSMDPFITGLQLNPVPMSLLVIVEKRIITSLDVQRKSLTRKKRAIERGEAENGCILFEFGSVYHLWVSVEFGAMGQLLVRKYMGLDNKKIPYLLVCTI